MGTNAKLLLQFRRHLSHYDRFNGEFYDEDVDTWDSSIAEPGRPGILTVFSGGSYGAAQRGDGPHGPAPATHVVAALTKLERAVPDIVLGYDDVAWLDHWASEVAALGWGKGRGQRGGERRGLPWSFTVPMRR